MRILDNDKDQPIIDVLLMLTLDEAIELRDSIDDAM